MKCIEVVAAVFKDDEGRYFCTRRKDKGELALKWEFPGGKIEKGETHKEALVREIKEELSVYIDVKDFIMTVKHQYINFYLTMHVYFTDIISGELVLNEHLDSKWLHKDELQNLDWAEADLPIINELK